MFSSRRMLHMQAPRPVALLAAHIPLRHLMSLHVVVHRMTPVTRRPRRPVKVRRPIKRHPPIRTVLHVIRQPFLLRHVPLRRQRIVVIPALRKIPLLPPAPIHKRNLIDPERHHRIGVQKIPKHRLRMLLRIAHHIRHPRLLPARIRRRMTTLAALRSHKVSLRRRCLPLRHTRKQQDGKNSEGNQPNPQPRTPNTSHNLSATSLNIDVLRSTSTQETRALMDASVRPEHAAGQPLQDDFFSPNAVTKRPHISNPFNLSKSCRASTRPHS